MRHNYGQKDCFGNHKKNTGNVQNVDEVPREEKAECVQEFLRKRSQSIQSPFLGTFTELHRRHGISGYSVFTIEPLQRLHLKISKLVKEYTVSYLSLDRLRTGRGREEEQLYMKYECWSSMGAIFLLTAIESGGALPITRIDFLKRRHQLVGMEVLSGLGYM